MKKYRLFQIFLCLFLLFSNIENAFCQRPEENEKFFFVDPDFTPNYEAYTYDGGVICNLKKEDRFTIVNILYDNPKRMFFGLVSLSDRDIVNGKEVWRVSYHWGQMVTFTDGKPVVDIVYLHSPKSYKESYKIPAGTYRLISPVGNLQAANEYVKINSDGTGKYWYDRNLCINIPQEPAGGRRGGGRGITKITTLTGGYPVVISGTASQNFKFGYSGEREISLTPTGKVYTNIKSEINKDALAKMEYYEPGEKYPKPQDRAFYNSSVRDMAGNFRVKEGKQLFKEKYLAPQTLKIYNKSYYIVGVTDEDIVLYTGTGDDKYNPGSYRILTKAQNYGHHEYVSQVGDEWAGWCTRREIKNKEKEEQLMRDQQLKKEREERANESVKNNLRRTCDKMYEKIEKALRLPGFRNGFDARSWEVDSYNEEWDDIRGKFMALDANKKEDVDAFFKFKDYSERMSSHEIEEIDINKLTIKINLVIKKSRKKNINYSLTLKYSSTNGKYRISGIDILKLENQ